MKLEEMNNSELLAHFLIARDNVISVRRAMTENEGVDLQELYEMELETYEEYLKEVHRRMIHGNKR